MKNLNTLLFKIIILFYCVLIILVSCCFREIATLSSAIHNDNLFKIYNFLLATITSSI